tara:strand:- start:866 stop:1369 length:504 start_codon:yes stop_codon:yes gene_type:complete
LGQEFVIKSEKLEDKINQLLPSQGGFQAGVDLSASTMVVPIVDLTESAEGSNLRQDLQTSFSLKSVTALQVSNATSTVVNTTGYFRVFGSMFSNSSGTGTFSLTDGTTTKQIFLYQGTSGFTDNIFFDFLVFITAGDSLTVTSSTSSINIDLISRQVADINGNLVNP